MSASIAGYSLHGGRYLKLHTASAERPDGNVAAAGICATEHARLFNMSTAEDAELLRLLVKQQGEWIPSASIHVEFSLFKMVSMRSDKAHIRFTVSLRGLFESS